MKLDPEFLQAIEERVITRDEALALQKRFGRAQPILPIRPTDAQLWDAISRFDLWIRKVDRNPQ
jgi:hypothetical protein